MRCSNDRSITFYRLLMRGYPRRFRAIYEEAIVDAVALELERARERRSPRALLEFWAFMLLDLVAGVAMMRAWDAWRRLAHDARLVRGSTGFTAALATLAVIPVWALSRFATSTPGHGPDATVTFCVAALHAIVMWALAHVAGSFYVGAPARCRRVRYTTVRRARLVARIAKMSATIFVIAAISTARRWPAHEALLSPNTSLADWFFLASTLAAIVCLYFAVDGWLRVELVRRDGFGAKGSSAREAIARRGAG
jgi:hypothetical protein